MGNSSSQVKNLAEDDKRILKHILKALESIIVNPSSKDSAILMQKSFMLHWSVNDSGELQYTAIYNDDDCISRNVNGVSANYILFKQLSEVLEAMIPRIKDLHVSLPGTRTMEVKWNASDQNLLQEVIVFFNNRQSICITNHHDAYLKKNE